MFKKVFLESVNKSICRATCRRKSGNSLESLETLAQKEIRFLCSQWNKPHFDYKSHAEKTKCRPKSRRPRRRQRRSQRVLANDWWSPLICLGKCLGTSPLAETTETPTAIALKNVASASKWSKQVLKYITAMNWTAFHRVSPNDNLKVL